MALLTEAVLDEAARKAKLKAYEYWLSIQKPEYKNSLAVYKDDEDLYHISDNPNIKDFFPKIPNFLKEGEDNTIARICTSTVILDALIGMVDTSTTERLRNRLLTVYRFRPFISVRPTKKALPNNTELNERWIVGYDPSRSDYRSEKIADIFIDTLTRPNDGKLSFGGYILAHDDVRYHNNKIAKGREHLVQFFVTVDVSGSGIEVVDIGTSLSSENWFDIIGA